MRTAARIVALCLPRIPVAGEIPPQDTRYGATMAQVRRKTQLSKKELKQLTLWGGLLLIILLVLVYGLVRAGAIIPVGNAVVHQAGEGVKGSAANSHP
jgi:hypothetical protein